MRSQSNLPICGLDVTLTLQLPYNSQNQVQNHSNLVLLIYVRDCKELFNMALYPINHLGRFDFFDKVEQLNLAVEQKQDRIICKVLELTKLTVFRLRHFM